MRQNRTARLRLKGDGRVSPRRGDDVARESGKVPPGERLEQWTRGYDLRLKIGINPGRATNNSGLLGGDFGNLGGIVGIVVGPTTLGGQLLHQGLVRVAPDRDRRESDLLI